MIKEFDKQSLLVFKCFIQTFYELERLKHDLTFDQFRVLKKTFNQGGVNIHDSDSDAESQTRLKGRYHYKNANVTTLHDSLEKPLQARLKIRLNRLPIGYKKVSDTIAVDGHESKFVLLVFLAFIHFKSIRILNVFLASCGFNDTNYNKVYRILTNCTYAGLCKLRGHYYDVQSVVPPIINADIFFKSREGLRGIGRTILNSDERFSLNRLIKSTYSNNHYCGYTKTKKSGLTFRYYRTTGSQCHNIKAEHLEKSIATYIPKIWRQIELRANNDYFLSIFNEVNKTFSKFVTSIRANQSRSTHPSLAHPLNEFFDFFAIESNFCLFGIELVRNFKMIWRTSDERVKREILFILFPYGVKFDHKSKEFDKIVMLGEPRR